MDNNPESDKSNANSSPIAFKAETKQILEILIHSLYTEREVFLRELISNASDALTRINFELLTNRQALDPQAELAIRVIPNEARQYSYNRRYRHRHDRAGTDHKSGYNRPIRGARTSSRPHRRQTRISPTLIGQFGVGFYSAFMVAEWITVISRSYLEDAEAASWYCTGADTFTVEPAEKDHARHFCHDKTQRRRAEFLQEARLREIVRKHSDFIPFPIYIGRRSRTGQPPDCHLAPAAP